MKVFQNKIFEIEACLQAKGIETYFPFRYEEKIVGGVKTVDYLVDFFSDFYSGHLGNRAGTDLQSHAVQVSEVSSGGGHS